jgi:PilZ domain
VNYLHQLFALPYAHIWIPGVSFIVVGSGLYWLLRQAPQLAGSTPAGDAEADHPGMVPLKTASLTQTPEANKEKRQAVRRRGNPVEVRCAIPDEKEVTEEGSVLDRSVGGVRICVPHEFDVGAILSVRPTDAPTMVPWIDVEVRSCRPSTEFPGDFELGCQFVKTPPFPILMLFG